MTEQNLYGYLDAGYPGQLASNPHTTIVENGYAAEDIPYGHAIALVGGTAAADFGESNAFACELPDTSSDIFGVALGDITQEQVMEDFRGASEGRRVNILRRGQVYVSPISDVLPAGDVHVYVSGSDAGRFTGISDGTNTVELESSTWLSPKRSGGVAKADIQIF